MRRLFELSFRAQRGIYCALLCTALVLPAHGQMRGGFSGRGFSSGHSGGFHGGAIIGNRGFISRPFHHQRSFSRPLVPFGVAVPMWWDEPEVVEPEEAPLPQPIVVVVNRDDKREETPARVSGPLVIEREGDHYVQRPALPVVAAPASRREVSSQTAPKPALIVLRSGEQFELTDYAITTDALYDLRGGHTKKIEVAQIDGPATKKANAARGVEFTLPASVKLE